MSRQSSPTTVPQTMSGRWASYWSTLSLVGTHGNRPVPETKHSQPTSVTTTFCRPSCPCPTSSTRSSRQSSVSTQRNALPSLSWRGEFSHARPSQRSLARLRRYLFLRPPRPHPHQLPARASSMTARSKRSIFAIWPRAPCSLFRLEARRSALRFCFFLAQRQSGQGEGECLTQTLSSIFMFSLSFLWPTRARTKTKGSPPTASIAKKKKNLRAQRVLLSDTVLFFFIHCFFLFICFPAAYPQGQGEEPYPLLFSFSSALFLMLPLFLCCCFLMSIMFLLPFSLSCNIAFLIGLLRSFAFPLYILPFFCLVCHYIFPLKKPHILDTNKTKKFSWTHMWKCNGSSRNWVEGMGSLAST